MFKDTSYLFKDVSYDLLVLDDHTLEYREEDGTVWVYTRNGLPEE